MEPLGTQVPATLEIEGYESVNGQLVPWIPVNGKRKLTSYSKMRCPLCQGIVGVGYSGKHLLELHQNSKRCINARQKLLGYPRIKQAHLPSPRKVSAATASRARKVASTVAPVQVEDLASVGETAGLKSENLEHNGQYYTPVEPLETFAPPVPKSVYPSLLSTDFGPGLTEHSFDPSVGLGSYSVGLGLSMHARGSSIGPVRPHGSLTSALQQSSSARGSSASLMMPKPVYHIPAAGPRLFDASSPLVEDSSVASSVEDMLLTPPAYTGPFGYGSLSRPVLPPPPSLVSARFHPGASVAPSLTGGFVYPYRIQFAYAPIVEMPHIDNSNSGLGYAVKVEEEESCFECIRQSNCEPSSTRLLTPIVIDHSLTTTELESTHHHDTPTTTDYEAWSTCPSSEYSSIRAPGTRKSHEYCDTFESAKYLTEVADDFLLSGAVASEAKCWGEASDGEMFFAMLKEPVGKSDWIERSSV
ncbi:hypothetical protein RhiJN_17483 [Ceratobasidium sp. AG-Ba]|nr:hypothetical protein RhiJN_17483 [Ceratobasidium sp. AG-Ba]